MRFLIEWETKPENRKTMIKLLREFKKPEEVKNIFPIHNCVGSGRGFAVAETDSAIALQKMLGGFMDYVSYVVTPIFPVEVK